MSLSNARSLVDRFSRLRTLVIGDLMLDHFIWGNVSRISPEAPVPVVEVIRETEMPGGAGNVAANMAALGAQVHLVGLIGEDSSADRLLSMLQRCAIRTEQTIRTPLRPTIVKTRIIAHHQQVVRFDRELKGELVPEIQRLIWERVESALQNVDAIVLSDYAKGVVSRELIAKLIPMARRRAIPITVDPKVENFSHYRQVTCITPNFQEALGAARSNSVRSEEELEELGTKLLRDLDAKSILITRGEKGMSLFEKKRPVFHIPTRAREVFDVTGAGDTVISTLTLALAAGADLRTSAELANYAAGIVVGKLGTASVSAKELLKVVRSNHG